MRDDLEETRIIVAVTPWQSRRREQPQCRGR
jgi:hypothetical protein